MTVTEAHVGEWLQRLKQSWEAGDGQAALALFSKTQEYYERPFTPGTTQEEFAKYWEDINGLDDIRFTYQIAAISGSLAVVHWQNAFVTPDDKKEWLLDGVFFIEFDSEGNCRVFRQWWFARD